MVKVIMGPKGTGKTKILVSLVKQAVEEENGNVIFVEKDKNLTYDIPYAARLINACDYQISSYEFLRGFISGLYAGNYDISHIFIDNFFKIVGDSGSEAMAEFLDWLEAFSRQQNVTFTISATADPEKVSDAVKKYF